MSPQAAASGHASFCAGRRDAGICDNHPTISARIVEQCTLGAIERDFLDDRVIAEVVREYAAERRRLKASRVQADRRRSRHLGEVERFWIVSQTV